jgi:hypothetical protein
LGALGADGAVGIRLKQGSVEVKDEAQGSHPIKVPVVEGVFGGGEQPPKSDDSGTATGLADGVEAGVGMDPIGESLGVIDKPIIQFMDHGVCPDLDLR